MSFLYPKCNKLQDQVQQILSLLKQENQINFNSSAVEASLKKAIAPKFEIVFAGAFSAGKSMLINALLGRELLYSAEGHATGTECYIDFAQPGQEKVVLTFLSKQDIENQANTICQQLSIIPEADITEEQNIKNIIARCDQIIEQEGGESKSETAKKAKALTLLLEGLENNRDRIDETGHRTHSMQDFNFANLEEAASYARRGSNSAVLKKVEYYCNHPLLEDGNVLVDMPGIDAPVQKDAELTYEKVKNPDTSAVICVLKPAAAGEMTSEETELLEIMKSNLGIRDRVFYVFNRIDETWYNNQLRQRLDNLINSQFNNNHKIYKTSGLLGFYGSQIQKTSISDRFGLDSLFAESSKIVDGIEETPQFVSEFNNYCANSGKLTNTDFKISVNSYETPNQNYTRILNECESPLIKQLISDSGIESFRDAITRYLTEEKRPQLFASLAEDLKPLCQELKAHYAEKIKNLDGQPKEIEAMKAQKLANLNQELHKIGSAYEQHLETKVNDIVTNSDGSFEKDFAGLKAKMVTRLDELLQTFSVQEAYSKATRAHPRNATAPLIAILVEALYSISNQLEDVLVEESQKIVSNFCHRIQKEIQNQEYYRQLVRLLGSDDLLIEGINRLKEQLNITLVSEAKTECDRYVRESPRFYDEKTFSLYQFRQTVQQTSQAFDCKSMVQAEPAIRQLLKLDFEPKVSKTICCNFRQAVNQTLKTQLLPLAKSQSELISQNYLQAKANLEKTLEQEVIAKIAHNQKSQQEVDTAIRQYNSAIAGINGCLETMQLIDYLLPKIILTTKQSTQTEQDETNDIHEEYQELKSALTNA